MENLGHYYPLNSSSSSCPRCRKCLMIMVCDEGDSRGGNGRYGGRETVKVLVELNVGGERLL